MIREPHATLQGAVTWLNQCHDRATLQGVRIPSAILKIVFRHILFYFFLFLIQFRLWRVAAFVSSPFVFSRMLRSAYDICPGRLSVCRLSSVVCLSVCRLSSVALLHPTQRLEPLGNIFAPPNSLLTQTLCIKTLGKNPRSSRGPCKINTRGMKNCRFSTNRPISLYFIKVQDTAMRYGTISNNLQWPLT